MLPRIHGLLALITLRKTPSTTTTQSAEVGLGRQVAMFQLAEFLAVIRVSTPDLRATPHHVPQLDQLMIMKMGTILRFTFPGNKLLWLIR